MCRESWKNDANQTLINHWTLFPNKLKAHVQILNSKIPRIQVLMVAMVIRNTHNLLCFLQHIQIHDSKFSHAYTNDDTHIKSNKTESIHLKQCEIGQELDIQTGNESPQMDGSSQYPKVDISSNDNTSLDATDHSLQKQKLPAVRSFIDKGESCWILPLIVENTRLDFLVDSGATKSLIDTETFKVCFLGRLDELHQPEMNMWASNDTAIEIYGEG